MAEPPASIVKYISSLVQAFHINYIHFFMVYSINCKVIGELSTHSHTRFLNETISEITYVLFICSDRS